MDPNANLKEQLELAYKIHRLLDNKPSYHGDTIELEDAANELAERVIDLNRWIINGGFLPEKWGNKQ